MDGVAESERYVCTGMMYCCTDVGGDGGESLALGIHVNMRHALRYRTDVTIVHI
jgi:hypothetical protein